MHRISACLGITWLLSISLPTATPAAPATQPADGKLPFIQVDVKHRQVRVACEACSENMDVGLEFFCVATGTNEYEAVLRTKAKPSHVHLGLLMLGLEAGEPVKYSEAAKKWMPPHGPPLNISCEWKDPKKGTLINLPAYRLMRSIKDKKKEIPAFTWIFSGSKVMEDGKYAADTVGYFVSVLNNELSVIDVPQLASRDLESRQMERNTDVLPPTGTEMWMIIEPAGKPADAPKPDGADATPLDPKAVVNIPPETTTQEKLVIPFAVDELGRVTVDSRPTTLEELPKLLSLMKQTLAPFSVRLQSHPDARKDIVEKVVDAIKTAEIPLVPTTEPLSDVAIDEAKVKSLRQKWEKIVAPHNAALREAAQAHYEVIEALRREQQRLIDEADRVQRVIDQLQKDYSDMTTPRPVGQ